MNSLVEALRGCIHFGSFAGITASSYECSIRASLVEYLASLR
jgi:hypothetical protein